MSAEHEEYGKMNKKYKKIWVEALRSRTYKQTTGTLQDGNSFCCLGVLCHVTKTPYDGGEGTLNVEQEEKFGVSTNVVGRLIQLNDDRRLKFGQIANWIDKNL